MSYRIDIFDAEFNPFEVLCQHQNIAPNVGAQSVFVGYMRDFREHTHVERMTITHYPPMTEKSIEKLIQPLIDDYHLIDVYVAHRVGEVEPTSPLVVIAVLASHRANAIRAAEKLLEQLKHNVPFWKKEYLNKEGQGTWVDGNTSNDIQPPPKKAP